MSREEKFRREIVKALNNGWDMFGFAGWDWNVALPEKSTQVHLYCYRRGTGVYPGQFHLNDIVFSKDFCKAYFGDEEVCGVDGEKSPFCKIHSGRWGVVWKPAWNFHRHQMLDSEDVVEYMFKFL